jgi:ribonuclease P protein component
VVPKRHARRAVTRCLLKRQIRAVVSGHADALARGLWVVRLRAPFDRAGFVSARAANARRGTALSGAPGTTRWPALRRRSRSAF